MKGATITDRRIALRSPGNDIEVTVPGRGERWVQSHRMSGYVVFDIGGFIEVWRLTDDKRNLIAVLTSDADGEFHFRTSTDLKHHQPSDRDAAGTRIACIVNRELARQTLEDAGVVTVSLNSRRDVRAADPISDCDIVTLLWSKNSLHLRGMNSRSKLLKILERHGRACVKDPFVEAPPVRIIWNERHQTLWATDPERDVVLGGFPLDDGRPFGTNDRPEWIVREGGEMVASTTPAGS